MTLWYVNYLIGRALYSNYPNPHPRTHTQHTPPTHTHPTHSTHPHTHSTDLTRVYQRTWAALVMPQTTIRVYSVTVSRESSIARDCLNVSSPTFLCAGQDKET